MPCTAWNDSLTERLYGEIDAENDAALTAHLESCASCRETLDEFRRVSTLLREDEPNIPRTPRVIVLHDRSKLRPALLAASLLGAAVLAGAGAGAGYALGLGRAPVAAAVATPAPATPGVSTEELVRREVDRRLAALQDSRTIATGSNPGGAAAGERPVDAKALGAELAKFERRLDGARAADLEFVLDQIAASEFRVGARLGKTNQALRSVALASNPYVNEQ
jgi:Putative zinc-finger